MKTMNTIFAVIFAVIALMALVATLCGHTHQLMIFALSAVMATAAYNSDKDIDQEKQQ